MNDSLKLNFTDQLQKALTKSCYARCKTIKNKQCFDTCFQKFVRSVATVNDEIKQLAYQKHSLFGYKGYPQPSITNAYYYDDDITVNLFTAPFAWNKHYAA